MAGVARTVPPNPNQNDPFFQNTRTILIGNNTIAIEACRAAAGSLGYTVEVLGSSMHGEARIMAASFVTLALLRASELTAAGRIPPVRHCLLGGGEITVTLKGSGKGGRNQEAALAAALLLHTVHVSGTNALHKHGTAPEHPGTPVMLFAGTDGQDGPCDVAGAIAEPSTVSVAWAEHLRRGTSRANRRELTRISNGGENQSNGDENQSNGGENQNNGGENQSAVGLATALLDNNDSYAFFSLTTNHYRPGITGTNVMDLYVTLI